MTRRGKSHNIRLSSYWLYCTWDEKRPTVLSRAGLMILNHDSYDKPISPSYIAVRVSFHTTQTHLRQSFT